MDKILTIFYIIIAIFVIWWLLSRTRRFEANLAHHGSDPHALVGTMASESTTLPRSAAEQERDDLTRIRGIGKVIEPKLHDLGITSFDQIARFTPADIERVNDVLSFKGRIERERWVEQAKELVAQKRR